MSGRDLSETDLLFAAWAEAVVRPEAPPERLRRQLLDSVGGAARFRPFAAAARRIFDLTESGWAEIVRRIDEALGWNDSIPGVAYFHFPPGAACGAGAESGVVRVEPGALFPRHRHLGPETTFVLDGLLLDQGGSYGPGSVVESAGGSEHDYRAGAGRDLLILSLHHGIEFI
jgi:hypothetical protein